MSLSERHGREKEEEPKRRRYHSPQMAPVSRDRGSPPPPSTSFSLRTPPPSPPTHPAAPMDIPQYQDTYHSREDDDLDSHPLSYFLTPADDTDIDEFHLSAGIEDSSRPEPEFRSISPSSLSQHQSPSCRAEDDMSDAEEERYLREAYIGFGLPVSLQEFSSAFEKRQVRRKAASTSALSSGLRSRGILKPPRGRSMSRYGVGRPHSWREPSPDVWSIAEEDESGERARFERKRSVKKVHWELG